MHITTWTKIKLIITFEERFDNSNFAILSLMQLKLYNHKLSKLY